MDDDPVFTGLLKDRLESGGYSSSVSFSLKSAEENIKATNYRYIILDINLPDGDGLDFVERMPELFSGSIIIVVSAFLNSKKRQKAESLGVHKIFEKPCSPTILLREIDIVHNRKE